MNLQQQDDDFGDASFLEDFDPDAAIRESQQNDGDASFLEDFDPDAAIRESQQNEHKRRKLVDPLSNQPQPADPSSTHSNEEALKKTLTTYFGYSDYRGGQLEVIQALLQKRDCAVFWPTGFGKSLCFSIPPLHMDKVAIVVSPLISLMQDQVHKLNGLSDRPLAAFLGSAQLDPTIEQGAMQGTYPLVYVTPEKLSQTGFLHQLEVLHQRKEICLFAIDEAHCVSEWGNDFRGDYREIGSSLRGQPALANIPIVALTATATDRVRQDITASLRLRNPLQAKRSFDRTNLKIRVVKRRGGIAPTLTELARCLNDEASSVGSTIVYAPTRAQVEEIALFLQKNISSGIRIESYHAGMSSQERSRVHTDFLTGTCQVIVATVAFGMGIDKPDIRRIVHYTPPKTVEEYYQQIGRAGRDGLAAECILYVSDSDFNRYKTDFYLGNLSLTARQATEKSMDRLRAFALDMETCRRKSLLDYFNERPPFGDRCGTCDVCLIRQTYGQDAQRDFGQLGARIVLQAVAALKDQGLTVILKVIGGTVVESFRYQYGAGTPAQVQEMIQEMKAGLAKQFPAVYFRELVAPLVQKGFLRESNKSATVSGYQKTWTVYQLSSLGKQALCSPTVPIALPVPEYVRNAEKQEEDRRQRVLAELTNKGLKKEKIPENELENGDGDVIRAYSKWYCYLDGARRSGKEERLANLEALLGSVEKWRSETAVKYRMAPHSVLAEHTLVSIAYTTATLTPGMKLDKESIVAAGVRTREVDGLVSTLAAWVDEAQPATSAAIEQNQTTESLMVLGETHGTTAWKYALYRPVKKTGVAVWEASYNRFVKGESPQTIAMTPAAGKKPVQVKTVVSHLLDALTHGRNVDLRLLAEFMKPPTKREWEELQAAELSTGMNVCDDPAGDHFTMTEYLRPVVGNLVVDTPFSERTDANKELFGKWCDLLKWYMALRRAGYDPTFS